jgi:pimeloyl-ACP methyl ester carboxylesterase
MAAAFAFVHGGAQGSWVWAETIAALQAQSGCAALEVCAFDAPGCGTKRGENTSELTVKDAAGSIVADLESSGLDDVVLVGHSNAGTILPIVAGRRPELIRRLVYVSCIAPAPGQSIATVMGTSRQGERDDEVGFPHELGADGDPHERFRNMFCNDMTPGDADAFMARLGQDMWPSALARSGDVDWRYDHLARLPATYVFCLRDQALPPVWQERFASRFQVKRRVSIDAGHQVMNTRPHALAEVLRHEAEQA